jgi:hypothetical protein
MKGMIVNVYRSSRLGDCSCNGVSSRHEELTIVGPGIPEVFNVTSDRPPMKLETHYRGIVRLVPLEPPPSGSSGPMFGGNYAATSDSRITAAIERMTGNPFHGAICIHDRYERS